MASRNGIPGGYRGEDELDEYLRNEYRAEEGAYLERRSAQAQYGGGEPEPRFWGARLPTGYYLGESSTRTGTMFPHDEPLHRDETGFQRRVSSASSQGTGAYNREPRYSSSGRSRTGGAQRHSDREGARELVQATENFYRDLTSAIGLNSRDGRWRDHRGRGPRSYRRPDGSILDDIGDRLTEDGYIDASDIEISVQDQEVTLSGTVSTRLEKRRAEDIAEAVSGVKHVQNNLRVRPR